MKVYKQWQLAWSTVQRVYRTGQEAVLTSSLKTKAISVVVFLFFVFSAVFAGLAISSANFKTEKMNDFPFQLDDQDKVTEESATDSSDPYCCAKDFETDVSQNVGQIHLTDLRNGLKRFNLKKPRNWPETPEIIENNFFCYVKFEDYPEFFLLLLGILQPNQHLSLTGKVWAPRSVFSLAFREFILGSRY